MWSREERKKFSTENPKMHNSAISKILGQQWRNLPEDEKAKSMEKSKELRKEHMQKNPDYKYKPRRKAKPSKKQNQALIMSGPEILIAPKRKKISNSQDSKKESKSSDQTSQILSSNFESETRAELQFCDVDPRNFPASIQNQKVIINGALCEVKNLFVYQKQNFNATNYHVNNFLRENQTQASVQSSSENNTLNTIHASTFSTGNEAEQPLNGYYQNRFAENARQSCLQSTSLASQSASMTPLSYAAASHSNQMINQPAGMNPVMNPEMNLAMVNDAQYLPNSGQFNEAQPCCTVAEPFSFNNDAWDTNNEFYF